MNQKMALALIALVISAQFAACQPQPTAAEATESPAGQTQQATADAVTTPTADATASADGEAGAETADENAEGAGPFDDPNESEENAETVTFLGIADVEKAYALMKNAADQGAIPDESALDLIRVVGRGRVDVTGVDAAKLSAVCLLAERGEDGMTSGVIDYAALRQQFSGKFTEGMDAYLAVQPQVTAITPDSKQDWVKLGDVVASMDMFEIRYFQLAEQLKEATGTSAIQPLRIFLCLQTPTEGSDPTLTDSQKSALKGYSAAHKDSKFAAVADEAYKIWEAGNFTYSEEVREKLFLLLEPLMGDVM